MNLNCISLQSATAMRKCAKVSVVDTRKVMDDETLKTASAVINDTCVSMEFSSRCQYDVSQASVIGQ